MKLKDQLEQNGGAVIQEGDYQYYLQQRIGGVLVDVYRTTSLDFGAADRWWISTGSTENNVEQFQKRLQAKKG